MISCLVFSKDRAMQLDAFLRSAAANAPYASTTVFSPRRAEVSYYCVEKQHPLVYHYYEDLIGGFEMGVRRWLAAAGEWVVFHTDDDVIFRKIDILDVCYANSPDELPPASFRLGRNTTRCHPLDYEQKPPLRMPWLWRRGDGDFGYPLALNATVYRSADLLPLLDFSFANPTELEAGLAARAGRFAPEWMTAPLHSCSVSLPHNRVSVSAGAPAGSNPAWQPDALARMYLDGWRIDLDAMDFSAIVGAHQEVPLKFRRGEERC